MVVDPSKIRDPCFSFSIVACHFAWLCPETHHLYFFFSWFSLRQYSIMIKWLDAAALYSGRSMHTVGSAGHTHFASISGGAFSNDLAIDGKRHVRCASRRRGVPLRFEMGVLHQNGDIWVPNVSQFQHIEKDIIWSNGCYYTGCSLWETGGINQKKSYGA